MNDVLSIVINLLMLLSEVLIYVLLAGTFFAGKKAVLFRGAVWCCAIPVSMLLLPLIPDYPIKMAAMVVLYTCLVLFTTNAALLPALFSTLASSAILYLSDTITATFYLLLSGRSFAELQEQPYLFTTLGFSSKMVAILMIVLVQTAAQHLFLGRKHHPSYDLSCCIFPVSALCSSVLLFAAAQKAPAAAPYLLLCMVFLVCADICSVFLLGYLEAQRDKLTQSLLLEQELTSAMTSLNAARQSYESERKQTHDFQNQLMVLTGMLENSEGNQAALNYLKELGNQVGSSSLSISTNRLAVDVLLNQKYQLALAQSIRFEVRLCDLAPFPLPDNALVVLLSNLLDNALEACAKLPAEAERYIIVKMDIQPTESLIYIKNSAISCETQQTAFLTGKADQQRHGFGMKNIQAIVDRYHGVSSVQYQGNIFAFAASFAGTQETA